MLKFWKQQLSSLAPSIIRMSVIAIVIGVVLVPLYKQFIQEQTQVPENIKTESEIIDEYLPDSLLKYRPETSGLNPESSSNDSSLQD